MQVKNKVEGFSCFTKCKKDRKYALRRKASSFFYFTELGLPSSVLLLVKIPESVA